MPSTKMKKSTDSEACDTKREKEEFDLTDKVEYDDFTRENIPEEIIFPEELNRFLRDRIRELTAENGCLRRSLIESEERLSSVRKSSADSHTEESSHGESRQFVVSKSSEIAAAKIVELSKRCRDQTAELEVLRSRCKKLIESKLKTEINNKAEETKTPVDSGDGIDFRPFTVDDELKNREEEIKLLRDKVHQINSKFYESKNACTSLRRELNKAHKLLRREVGESVTIASLSSQNDIGWRGRAEQIKHLQNKLIDYEGLCSSGKGSSATLPEKRNLTNLRRIEKERKKRSEDSTRELKKLNTDLETCRRKRDAAKARVKVLESDFTAAKQSVALLNEKRSHDEQLINALNGQLKAVEDKFRDREKDLTRAKDRAENECVKMSAESNGLRSVNENLRRTIKERETEIDSLRNGSSVCAGEDKNRRYSPSSGERYTESRSNGEYNEYVTLGIAAEAERERLLELVVVLNRRLDEERFATDKIAETLRGERAKLAKLETKLQRYEMERVGMSKVNTGYKPRSSKSGIICSSGVEGVGERNETLKFRLELLEEECLALKTRLATVQRDKTSDLAVYKQMLYQARKTFQDAYRGKPNSSSYSTVTI